MQQSWKCDKCEGTYESPIAINGVTCSNKRCKGYRKEMRWVSGAQPPERVRAEKLRAKKAAAKAKPRTRARAVRVQSVSELSEQLRRTE